MDFSNALVAEMVVETLSPLLVGGRNEIGGFHVSTSVEGERAIIPATSLKGIMRHHIKRHVPDSELEKEFFGDKGDGRILGASVIFSDLVSEGELGDIVERRVRIKIDKHTKTVFPGHLVSIGAVKKGVEFKGKLIFRDRGVYEKFKRRFEGKELIVGRMKNAGFGRIKIVSIEEVKMKKHTLKPGLNYVFFKPLTPFMSTPDGKGAGKPYLVSSKNFVSGPALKRALEVFGVRGISYVSHVYPASKKEISIPSPAFVYREKHGEEYHYLLPELYVRRSENRAFAMKINGKRVDKVKGFVHIGDDIQSVELPRSFSAHVSIDERTGTSKMEKTNGEYVGIFFVYQAYKPKYLVATVVAEERTEIPEFLSIGSNRSRGYGFVEVETTKHISEDSLKSEWKGRIENFNREMESKKFLVPVVLKTHFRGDPKEVFGAELVDSIINTGVYRHFDGEKVYLIDSVLPGGVFVFSYRDVDEALDKLYELKLNGAGEFTELGFGDFEVAGR